MKRYVVYVAVVAVAVTTLGQTAMAGAPTLSMMPTPADLLGLTPGQTATIDVLVAGLDTGDELEFLAATIEYDGTIFGTPVITGGPIIPDLAGFLGIEDPGLADGSFDAIFTTSGTDTIADNGLFFSFELMAQAEGEGFIEFTFVDALGFTAAFEPIDGASSGSAVPYRVVPEPTAAALLMATGMLVLARRAP